MTTAWRALFVTVLFALALTLLTLEKIAYIWTLRVIRLSEVTLPVGYAAILLLLVTPYSIAFLQILWTVSFLSKCPDSRLPSIQNIFLGVLSSVLEGACVTWFTILAAVHLPVFVVLPATASVLSFSALSPWFSSWRGPKEAGDLTDLIKESVSSTSVRVQRCLGFLAMLGPTIAATILFLTGVLHWLPCLVLALSIQLLSIIWAPGVVFRTISVDGEMTLQCRRLSVLYALLKVLAVCFFLSLDLVMQSPQEHSVSTIAGDFFAQLSGIAKSFLLVPLLLSVTAGILSQAFVYLSSVFCQPLFGILVPSLLSTVTSIVLCLGLMGPYVYKMDELNGFGDLVPMLLAAGVLSCTWALSYVTRTVGAIQKPRYLFMPYETLFISYGWIAGFADQHRLLAYSAEGAAGSDYNQQAPKRRTKSRIYVCTTMYREADYEMERLLLSLQRLSGAEPLQNVYLEAHIFMDNGVSNISLGEFSQQLVGLLVSRLGLSPAETRCLLTPYGMQMSCRLPGGMSLFIHFKDPAKCKPKKRWSQCMYIHYVMNFRKVIWRQDNNCPPRLNSGKAATISILNEKSSPLSLSRSNSKLTPSVLNQIGDVGYRTFTEFLPDLPDTVDLEDQGFESSLSPSNSQSESDHGSDTSSATKLDSDDNKGKFAETDSFGKENLAFEPDKDMDSKPCTETEKEKKWNAQNISLFDFKFDPEEEVNDEHTYILATDADMDFEPEAVAELLRMCNGDRRLGAACGRTHPIGKKCSSIVWHQIFEYAKDFWMIKSAQNVIGSVMCCPGCFSLYRASALRQVMDKYATPTRTPFTVYVKDTGEDRWMATLMMINGWRLRYSSFADNTTYCPDTFQEFFKQRRRWILSDVANLVLVIQNLMKLLRNNDCFSLVYITYLLNMFLNNIITPGTAIVMITAGLELVFDVPYIYTTPPLAFVVYCYAFFCTRASTHVQTMVTTALTVILGSVFSAVAFWGSYKIVASMVNEIAAGHFRFQQHYVILMLTVSLLYAALVHPRETHQIVYGLAYLFIFPAMHLLLPIYSIANIIDQSWGTRDSQKAKIPKLRCIPNFKKMLKRRKKSNREPSAKDDTTIDIQQMMSSIVRPMAEGCKQEREENAFWINLGDKLIGNDVNTGLEKSELGDRLRKLRNRSLFGLMLVNGLWLALLSYFYIGVESSMSRLNLYGVISGALYGFTLLIQVIGMTIWRVSYILRKGALYLYGDTISMWVNTKTKAA